MNLSRFDVHHFTFAPLPVSSVASSNEYDDDWAEFLALGIPADASDLSASAPWARSPVLLSY